MAKEHTNKVTIKGLVADIRHNEGQKDGVPFIAGEIMIEAGEDNIIPVGFYASEKKKDGNPNPMYASISTVVEEFKTIANSSREEADFIDVGLGKVGENAFYTKTGAFVQDFRIQAPFYNRITSGEKTPQATFTVQGEIIKVIDEVVKDVPTGNAILKMLVVGYGNRGEILNFVAKKPEAVEFLKNHFTEGEEVLVAGDIVVEEKIETKEEPTAFGDPIVEEFRTVKKQLVLTQGGNPVPSTLEDSERVSILSQREEYIQKNKEKQDKKNKSSNKKSSSASDFTL